MVAGQEFRGDDIMNARIPPSLGVLVFTVAMAQAAPPTPAKISSTGTDVLCTVPANKVQQVFVVVVDRTSIRDDLFNRKLLEAVGGVVAKPSTRLVLWRFGGVPALPSLVADVTTPAAQVERRRSIDWLVDAALKPSGAGDASQKCLADKAETLRSGYLERLKLELGYYDASVDGISPVVLAVSQAVAPFGVEAKSGTLRVLLASDGLEFGGKDANRPSFYPVDGRYPTPAEAVAKTGRYGGQWTGVQLSIAGLGVIGSPDIIGVTSLMDIWKAIISSRGAVAGELTTSVPQRLAD